jgi:hypothetical protein
MDEQVDKVHEPLPISGAAGSTLLGAAAAQADVLRRSGARWHAFANLVGGGLIVNLALIAIYTSVFQEDAGQSGAAVASTFAGQVIRIVDGDTFHISGQSVRIRLWALDTP